MTESPERYAPEEALSEGIEESILQKYPQKGKKALEAVSEGRVHRYLDFFVVDGSSDRYAVDDDFCTCHDFCFRGKICWHILAVRIARITGSYDEIDEWFQDNWNPRGDDETASNNNISGE